jgi:hypothetical protein
MAREVVYTTRERVKAAVDVKNSVRANEQIDRAIRDGSRSVERLCRRVFYPRIATQTFDWPDSDRPTPWVLWLGGDSELITVLTLTTAGTAIDVAGVKRYPSAGPPYTRLELDRSSATTAFGGGNTVQQNISLRALFGWSDDQTPAGDVGAAGITSFGTTLDVTDGSLVGVGSLLNIDTERLLVTERRTSATGLTSTAALTDKMNSITVTLSGTTGAPEPGEMILIDGERMLVQDRVGTAVYVTRAVDGSVLATHAIGAPVYAYRTLVVERGMCGTTAAIHNAGTDITAYAPPAAIEGLVIAEALNQIAQENTAYARVIGSGEGQREARGAGLADKRKRVRTEFGRRVRMGAV